MDVKDHATQILRNLDRMRKDKKHCDFIVKVGPEEIPVHKNVLSAGSDYFEAMLSYDTLEVQSGIVDMKAVCPDCVKKCIDFIYTGELSLGSNDDYQHLMNAAHFMQLQRICDEVALQLEDNLSLESFFVTRSIAYTYHCTKLAELCNIFALENFRAIAVQDDFKYLEEEYMMQLIGSKQVKACESIKCKALIVWANHNVEERTMAFQEMFTELDLQKISRRYKKYLVEYESLVITYDYAREVLLKLTDGFSMKSKDVKLEDHDDDNVIAVFDKSSNSIQAYDPVDKSWSKMQGFSDDFVGKSFCSAVIDNIIYVFVNGGQNYQLQHTDTNSAWVKLPDRVLTRKRVEVAAVNGSIYAFDDSNGLSDEVEKYDPTVGEWSRVTRKPVNGYSVSIVASKDFIYCIGGVNSTGNLSSLTKFDVKQLTWSKLRHMKVPRYGAAATLLDDRIYVIGGQCGYSASYCDVECFDTVAKTWSRVAKLNHRRHYFRACSIDGYIFVIGGENSRHTIESFDPDGNEWKIVETMEGYIEDRSSVSLYLSSPSVSNTAGPKERVFMRFFSRLDKKRENSYQKRKVFHSFLS